MGNRRLRIASFSASSHRTIFSRSGHRPADDRHRGQILDGGEVEPAFVSWDVRDASEPDRIGRNGFEVAVEQIGRDCMGVAAVDGDRRPPPASRWTNAVLSHELGDRALRDAQAAGLLLGMDPRRSRSTSCSARISPGSLTRACHAGQRVQLSLGSPAAGRGTSCEQLPGTGT